MPGGWRIAVVAVAALCAVTTAQRTTGAASDLVYKGPFGAGGSIRLTLSPDRAGIASFELSDVPYSICGSPGLLRPSAYYDPPSPIAAGNFELGYFYGDAHHHSTTTVQGTVTSDSRMEGTVQASEFNAGGGCNGQSAVLTWSAEGPVAEARHAGDLRYEGTLAGGQIVTFTSSDRTQLTGLKIEGAQMPCLGSPIHLDAIFNPPLELRPGNEFLGLIFATLGEQHRSVNLGVTATIPTPDSIEGAIDSGMSCGSGHDRVLWSATRVEVSPLNQPSTTPAIANGLPNTGRSGVTGASSALPLFFTLLASGALFIAFGLRLRGR
jgi:hypothetical protein